MDKIRFGTVPVLGKQKRNMPTLRLSPHSIALFRQCKLQYKFRYIDKLGEQYGKARPYFTMANHVHAALHDLFSSVSPEERTVEVCRQLLMNNWRRYRVGFKDKGDERRWAQRALNEITRFIVEQDITSTPLMLETPIEAEITPGLILRGRVDRVDKEPEGSLHIIDYKTGVLPESIDWTQLELHSLALSRSTTYTVSKVSYLYLLSGTLESRQLDRKSLDKTTWELLRIAKEIRAEKSYPPNPGPACAGCDFAPICPAKHEGYVKIGEVDLPLWRDFNDILLEE